MSERSITQGMQTTPRWQTDSGPEVLLIVTGVNEAGKNFGMKMKAMKTKSAAVSKKS